MNSYDLAALHRDTFPGQDLTPGALRLCIFQLLSLTSHVEEPTRRILVQTAVYDMVYRDKSAKEIQQLRQLLSEYFDDIYYSYNGLCCQCCLTERCYAWCGWAVLL